MLENSIIPFVARKYLKFDKSQPFISITAILAFLGVTVGVAVLLTAMGIMNGFDNDFRKKLFTMNYPLTIRPIYMDDISLETLDKLKNKFPDFKFSPFIRTQGIAKKGDYMEGVIVFGVDKESESAINEVYKKAVEGKNLGRFEAVVGKGLKDEFYLADKERLMVVFTQSEPVGFASTPLMKRFKTDLTFESGLIAYDKAYIYVNLEDLKKILKKDSFNGIHILSPNPMEDIKELKKLLHGEYSVVGWWEQNGNFFSALELEKKALFLVLMLIILVASLNIITSLLMTVMNRRREIALLLSLGATKQEVKKLFFIIGTIIGVFGVFIGGILGSISLWVLKNYDIVSLPADVYGTSRLPIDLGTGDFFSVILGALIIVVVSSYYPAKKASEVDVLGVLRNE